MKRYLTLALCLMLCLFVLFPTGANATGFDLGDTDLRISLDENSWYVFTRENLENNEELAELGLTEETIHDVLYNNEAYMDALLLYDNGDFTELLIRKRALDVGVANLSNYDTDEVMEMAEGLGEKQGTENYSVYESSYKWARLEYLDASLNYYVCEFVTVVNKDNYTLTFQSSGEFTEWEYEEIQGIVDSVRFDVDETLKEGKNGGFFDSLVGKSVMGGAIGGVVGVCMAIANQRKKKRGSQEDGGQQF